MICSASCIQIFQNTFFLNNYNYYITYTGNLPYRESYKKSHPDRSFRTVRYDTVMVQISLRWLQRIEADFSGIFPEFGSNSDAFPRLLPTWAPWELPEPTQTAPALPGDPESPQKTSWGPKTTKIHP